MTVHVVAGQVGLTPVLKERRRILQERHAELMRPCGHRHAHFQMRIHLLEVPVALRRRHGESLHLFAIQEHHDLVRLAQPLDLFVAVAGEPDLNLILAVARECVLQQCAAARARRQPFDVLFLREVGAKAKGVAARLAIWRADREPADFLGGGDVAVQQRRGEFADCHVIEAMTGVVFRQQRGGIDVQRQQIADGVLVFSAIEPTEGFGAPWVWMLRRRAVE